MNFSRNQYLLNSGHPSNELGERLYNNTHITEKLVRVRTTKLFIGEVDEEGFYLMGSSRMGVLCTLNGKFATDGKNTTIEIETKINQAFIILFASWAVIIAVLPLIGYVANPTGSRVSVGLFLFILLAVIGARFLLHFAYTWARNRCIGEIETIIA